jgi:hypothetical protein
VPLIVVTVDPWRDVPSRLPSIAAGWGLAPGDRVLSGSIEDVNAVLDAWGIARRRDAATGDVAHARTAVVIEKGGRAAVRLDGEMESLARLLAGA